MSSDSEKITYEKGELEKKLQLFVQEQTTGYWQIKFYPGKDVDTKKLWYLFFSRGRVVFSSFQPLSWQIVLATLKRYVPRLRSPAAQKEIQAIEQEVNAEVNPSMLLLLSKLTLNTKLINYQEVVEALKLQILNDFDQYLFDYSGQAQFIVDEELNTNRPVVGFELNELFATAKQRRYQWQKLKNFVPSMKFIAISNLEKLEQQNLTNQQKQQIKKLVGSGKSLQQISYDLGEDYLKIAQTFAKFIQKGLVELNSEASPSVAQYQTHNLKVRSKKRSDTEIENQPKKVTRYQVVSHSSAANDSIVNDPRATLLQLPQTVPDSSVAEKNLIVSDPRTTQPPQPPQAVPNSSAPEIFVVDDSPILLKTFKAFVTGLGYRVRCCVNAPTAVEAMLASSPAVIFLDVNMPEVSGFQLMKQIRLQPKLASIPLVVLTAEKSFVNQQRAKWSKSKFLSKPLNSEEIPAFEAELQATLQEMAPLKNAEESN